MPVDPGAGRHHPAVSAPPSPSQAQILLAPVARDLGGRRHLRARHRDLEAPRSRNYPPPHENEQPKTELTLRARA